MSAVGWAGVAGSSPQWGVLRPTCGSIAGLPATFRTDLHKSDLLLALRTLQLPSTALPSPPRPALLLRLVPSVLSSSAMESRRAVFCALCPDCARDSFTLAIWLKAASGTCALEKGAHGIGAAAAPSCPRAH